MSRYLRICLLYFLVAAPILWAQENTDNNESTHFVSDDLFVYLHTGPGRQFRILGSIQAGMLVTKTEREESNNYVEIIDSEGRTGWIESQFLKEGQSRRTLVNTLKEQTADAQSELAPLRQQISQLRQTSGQFEQEKTRLIEQVTQLTNQNQTLAASLQEKERKSELEWMMKGGGLVAGGLLLGILITFLPKRRKRSDNWLN